MSLRSRIEARKRHRRYDRQLRAKRCVRQGAGCTKIAAPGKSMCPVCLNVVRLAAATKYNPRRGPMTLHATEIHVRTCRFCKHSEAGEDPPLFKYAVRHWAHAGCLAARYGTIEALERIPSGDRKGFKSALRATWNEWMKARIRVKDDAIRRTRPRPAVPSVAK